MIPQINAKAASEITGILSQNDPENKAFYQNNLQVYLKRIDALSVSIRKSISVYRGVNVICSAQLEDVFAWLGFNVINTYGRPEDFSAKEMAEVMRSAKNKDLRIIADNLQDGSSAGVQLAKDLGARHIALSNFPLNDSYAETLRQNIDTIEKALK